MRKQREPIDYAGQRFGRLTIVKFVEYKRTSKSVASMWLCKCDCGNMAIIKRGALTSGNTKSCGCLAKENLIKRNRKFISSEEDVPLRNLYRTYKNGASVRNLSFELSLDEFREITKKDCFFCGVSPSQEMKSKWGDVYVYNGIDRLDNSMGYVNGNCVPCCKTCNYAKGSMSYDNFIFWIRRLVNKKQMNIALVMPKSTFLELPMVFQPLGLFYLAARLESLGHQCDFYDLNVDEFPTDTYEQVWVSATSPQLSEVKRIGKILKNYVAMSVLGGASVWANPESCKGLGYDLIVGGESDSPENINTILQALETAESDVDPNLHIQVPISSKLDWVLPPVRRWSRKYSSFLTNIDGTKEPCTTMFTSRGCPLECAFCESGRHGVIWDRLTRYEPLDVVEYQIKESKELGYNALAYYDDILPLNKRRTMELMKLHRKYDMIWRCFLRSDIINNQGGYDYLKEMRDGGLVEIFVGVESASNVIKNNITKKTTIEQDTNIVRWCKELGIRAKCSFILGLPGESRESMDETRKWILENRPDRVQVGRLIPFPGTPLGNHPENYDLKIERNVDDDWFYMGKNDMHHSFVSTSHVTVQEIDEFWHKLQKELDEQGISK